ncbi:hypothetical protein [Nocardioides mangrovi]|uniref:Ferric oxidoreductase domain-containing protein n=1 Tax=Nocardioides mangrovi TaxID=2874580 RepID=A0ABS7UA74_9ACTN|nr:hypothetical protein [Nocardioides mangrovi]MBZ5737889.1 hypothetical protein [Nocardioides mangrovi]
MTLWLLARAAGFAAYLTASIAVALGALAAVQRSATGPVGPRRRRSSERRLVLQLVHRTSAVLTLGLLALHVALLVTDRYVDLSLPGALVPFTAGYRGFALGLGTLAAYGFLLAGLTGALRGRAASRLGTARRWRVVHALAYLTWVLCLAHGLLAGTDTGTWWSWLLYGGGVTLVLTTVLARTATAEHEAAAPLAVAREDARVLAGRR